MCQLPKHHLASLAHTPVLVQPACCLLQGDIEKVASRTPEQLTQLFEQISGSDVLAKPYEVGRGGGGSVGGAGGCGEFACRWFGCASPAHQSSASYHAVSWLPA